MSTDPLLSIGMIFKNEARCLERCLRSLQPLRDAIPCELVMADTGAEDGSREIAEKYADEVFDFEWIDDFAAARNAVMDKCHGKWYLTIDCDEWLDADILELVTFLKGKKKTDFAFVIQRNYSSRELDKSELYSDFQALRLVQTSSGQRYHGAIHESWYYQEPAARLSCTILHHDGYFFTDPKAAKEKTQRNMKMLRQKLAVDPDNLGVLNQCIESGLNDADFVQYVRHAVQIVQNQQSGWETCGACILRHAVKTAIAREMPELEEWIMLAEKMFPDSIFVQVDINFAVFMAAHDAGKWEKAIHYGEAYRRGICKLHEQRLTRQIERDLGISSLHSGNLSAGRTLLIGLANAYLQCAEGKKAHELLKEIEGEKLDPDQVQNVVVPISQLHAQTSQDVAPILTAFYNQISQPVPDEQKKKARLAAFDTIAAASFTESYRDEEKAHTGYHRPAFTAFVCLADRCEAGRGAKLMLTDDPAEMRQILAAVEDWQALPIEALEHALAAGVPFPLPEQPLPAEVLDGLAARLTHGENLAWRLTLERPADWQAPDPQSLAWAQSLALAALRSFDWTLGEGQKPASKFYCPEKKKDETLDKRPQSTPETGLALLRRFAEIEERSLPTLYAPQLLTEQNAALLPPMHRWGFYCAQALRELDAGHPQAYLAALRRGLKACPGEKEMVQFLLDRFMEDTRPTASPELLELAKKVRAILSAYDPDDPAVVAIRQSPAYQQVAWLIEDPASPLPQ